MTTVLDALPKRCTKALRWDSVRNVIPSQASRFAMIFAWAVESFPVRVSWPAATCVLWKLTNFRAFG